MFRGTTTWSHDQWVFLFEFVYPQEYGCGLKLDTPKNEWQQILINGDAFTKTQTNRCGAVLSWWRLLTFWSGPISKICWFLMFSQHVGFMKIWYIYIYNIYTYLAGTFGLTVFSTPQWLKLRCYPHLLCWRLVSPALGGFVSVIWDPDSQGFRFQCNHQCSGLSEWLCFLCSNCFLSHLSHLSHEQARGRRWRSWDTGGGLSIFFTR